MVYQRAWEMRITVNDSAGTKPILRGHTLLAPICLFFLPSGRLIFSNNYTKPARPRRWGFFCSIYDDEIINIREKKKWGAPER